MSTESLIRSKGGSVTVERSHDRMKADGVSIKDWTQILATTGWVQPANSRIVSEYGRRGLSVTHRLYLFTEVEFKEGDRVVYDGVVYSVVGFSLDQAGVGQVWSVMLQRWQ